MVLYLIGLGLGDEYDITLKGLNAVRASHTIYLEHYTAILTELNIERLKEVFGLSKTASITLADRHLVESGSDALLSQSQSPNNCSLLVVGDPLCATTHCDLMLRAYERGIEVVVIHNASIINACGIAGLQLYQYGPIISIPYFTSPESRLPSSWLAKINDNYRLNYHTLCLLDIKVKEQSSENLAAGLMKFEEPRYMSVNQAIRQILDLLNQTENTDIETDTDSHTNATNVSEAQSVTADSRAFGLARVGRADQCIVSGTLSELLAVDFGLPLHSLIIAAPHLHDVEIEMFEHYHWNHAQRVELRQREKALREEKLQQRFQRELAAKKVQQEERMRALKEKKSAMKLSSAHISSPNPTESADEEVLTDLSPLI